MWKKAEIIIVNDIFPATKVIIDCEKNASIFIADVRSARNKPYG